MKTVEESRIEFGKRVRKRRLELDMSMETLSKLMGYKHRSAIQKIESGENSLPQDKVMQMANALDTTVQYLMGWEVVSDKVLAEYLFQLSEEYLKSTLPTEDEFKLISYYRKASDRDKALINSILNYESSNT